MLPTRLWTHFGWRVKAMALGGGTFYNWDSVAEQLVPAGPYQLYMMYSATGMVAFTMLLQSMQIYLKIQKYDGIPNEDGEVKDENENRLGGAASLTIAFGELLLIACIIFVNILTLKRKDIQMNLINQHIKYNKALNEMIDNGILVLGAEHVIKISIAKSVIYTVMTATLFAPFVILPLGMHPLEPSHVLVQEWVEIDFTLSYQLAPLILLIWMVVFCCTTTVTLIMLSIDLSWIQSTVMVNLLIPEGVARNPDQPQILTTRRCHLLVRSFGGLEDIQVVQLFRIQQVLNLLINEFLKSVLMSVHHVGCLAIGSCLLYFVISHHNILSEEGVGAYFVIFFCIGAVLSTIYLQAGMCGEVVDASTKFKVRGRKLVGRGTLFHKFCRSCQTFYIQVAWPFYTVHKETYLLFCEELLNYVVMILLNG